MNRLKFVDICSGIGGFRLAFSGAADCVFSSEIDEKARKTYRENFHEEPHGDITAVNIDSIPNFDILTAGFPCQTFSNIGNRKGFADIRGTIFFYLAEIIRKKRPKAIFLENVPGLLSHDKGRTIATILKILRDELGYYVFNPFIVNALHFGLPQNRKRVFIIGFLEPLNFVYPKLIFAPVKVKDILEVKVDEKYTLTDKRWDTLRKYAERAKNSGNGFGFSLVTPESNYTNTLLANYSKDAKGILVEQPGKNPRRLTPRECARLQGFPDSFVLPRGQFTAYKQTGNSVAVPCVKAFADSIINALNENHINKNTVIPLEQKSLFSIA